MRISQTNKPANLLIMAMILTAILTGGSLALAADNTPPETGGLEPRTITEGMTCATCGMYPHRYPQWQTQIIFSDGTMAAFDGCKCMFRYILNLQKFAPARRPEQIAVIWVKDFKTGQWLDGKSAHYVVGSKEMGPMGKELIPFATKASAEEFQKAKGGTIKTYATINMDTIHQLMGGMHMPMNMPHPSMH